MAIPRVFLSYSHFDRAWVAVFKSHLEQLLEDTVQVFWDQAMPSGSPWKAFLEREVLESDHFVLVASPFSLASREVRAERNLFAQQSKDSRNVHLVKCLPVQLDASWNHTHHVDATDPDKYRDVLRKVACALRSGILESDLPKSVIVDLPKPGSVGGLSVELFGELVRFIERILGAGKQRDYLAVGSAFDLIADWHKPFHGVHECANAALIDWIGGHEPIPRGLALLDRGCAHFGADDSALAPLASDLRARLRKFKATWDSLDEAEAANRDASPSVTRTPYIQALLEDCGTISLVGFPKRVKLPIQLEHQYVPLRVIPDARTFGDKTYGSSMDADHDDELRAGCTEHSIHDAIRFARKRNQRGCAILGDPGSGKTTLLRAIALEAARLGVDRFGIDPDGTVVLLKLRDFSKADFDAGLEHLIAKSFPKDARIPADLAKSIASGPLLCLIDGLDEVPATHRDAVSRWLDGLAKQSADRFILVTCRYAGYEGKTRLGDRFLELHLKPLDDDRVAEFITNWYRNVGAAESPLAPVDHSTLAKDLIDRLKRGQVASKRIAEMSGNPLLLTNVCLVHRDRGRFLPEARDALYEACLDVLLELWKQAIEIKMPWTSSQAKQVLQPIARLLHESNRTRASGHELEKLLVQPLTAIGWESTPRAFLEQIRDLSGVLVGWSGNEFGFLHLGFQEYLTARSIYDEAAQAQVDRNFEIADAVLEVLATQFGKPWWEEVIRLVLVFDKPALFTRLISRVLIAPKLVENEKLLNEMLDEAAGRCATPFQEYLGATARNLRDQNVPVVERILQRIDPSQARSSAASAKSQTSQHGSSSKHDSGIELVLIEPGEFWMGCESSQARSDEKPRHRVNIVRAFALARTPVTNAQYRRFVEATGYAAPGHWKDRSLNAEDQPVIYVSWDDARAFCKWASLRLPSEAEWEFACRAGTESEYWFGNDEEQLEKNAWYSKNANGTQAVGQKPANPWGLFDMHGNVWEWCEDERQSNYEGAPSDSSAWTNQPGSSSRVVRGGSWRDPAGRCRSSCRDAWPPVWRSGNLGFRPARFVTE